MASSFFSLSLLAISLSLSLGSLPIPFLSLALDNDLFSLYKRNDFSSYGNSVRPGQKLSKSMRRIRSPEEILLYSFISAVFPFCLFSLKRREFYANSSFLRISSNLDIPKLCITFEERQLELIDRKNQRVSLATTHFV